MKNISKKLKTLSITALLICSTGVSQTAYADIGLPDTPLFLGTSVPPNIFFAVDDSGSMNWDELLNQGTWDAGGVVTGQFAFWIANMGCCGDNWDREFRRLSCRGYNIMAYDPAVTYDPWLGVDSAGNTYVDATYPNARDDAYLPTPTVDISGHFYFPWTDADGDGAYDNPTTAFRSNSDPADECGDNVDDQTNAVLISSLTAAQQTNYANWYSYFRKREFVMKRSLSELITNSVSNMGLATLHNNASVGTPISDMTTQANKDTLMDELFQINSSGGTPLRRLLENTGEYYDQAGANSDHSPLGFTDASPIGTSAEGGECQQNFTVLFTDGQWNGGSPSVGNADGDDNTAFDGGPHADANSNTLADVAMDFYERDLATTLANDVPENDYEDQNSGVIYTDDNPQQHMVTYGVAFGLTGTGLTTPLDHDSATAPPPWTTPVANQDTTLDDLQHAAFNGRGLFLNADDPQELIDSLNDSLSDIDQRTSVSGSAIAINSTVLKTTSRIFQASFNSVDWTGELSAFSLNPDGTIDTEVWAATDKYSTITDPDQRDIFTSVSTGGIAFDDNPANAELNTAIGTLTVGATTYTADDLIHYISGDQTDEGSGPDDLRVRDEILGDIVSSSPISIGFQDLGYDTLPGFVDGFGVAQEGATYSVFLAAKDAIFTDGSGDPQTVVYVGANDGMFHAFHDSQKVAFAGKELFAYIPSTLHGALKDLANPAYGHKFYVNGGHSVGDACIANGSTCTWKSILVGTLGEGGRTVFALDVTDPFNFDASDVLWEYNFDDSRTGTTESGEMGFIKGTPQLVRLNNGDFGVVFANGYNSDSDQAQIFILDAKDGTEIAVFNTNIGDSSNENGMATPLIIDEDGDRIADTIYAGDLFGNLFKFDITGSNTNNWGTVFEASGPQPRDAEPLYQALDGNGDPQAITTKPTIVVNPESGFNIIFGTGKYIETSDTVVLTPYQVETMYSIWDNDNDNNSSQVGGRSNLQEQTIEEEIDVTIGTEVLTTRIISETAVDYSTNNPVKGWFMDALKPSLTAATANGERIIADPLTRFGRAIFTTFIPPTTPCDTGGTSVLMEVDALSGARLEDSVFDINGDGIIDDKDFVTDSSGNKVPVSGIYVPGTLTSPAVISLSDPDQEAKQLSGIDSQTTTILESTGGQTVGRQSWKQLK